MSLAPNYAKPARSGPRFALYSHDTMGLGHTRRNLLIARALVEAIPDATVLLIAGAGVGGRFDLPAGVDCVSLPSWHKGEGGSYASKSLRVSVEELRRVRMASIDGALRAFDPDLFLVDNVPSGALGELLPVLARLRREGRTRTVLGLRDVLDDPESVRREWRRKDHVRTVDESYDAVWVYGDATAYDVAIEYGFPYEVRRKLTHVGWLDAVRRLAGHAAVDVDDDPRPLYLGLVGGGQDGADVALAFARAEAPDGARRLLVTGPYMPSDVADRLCAAADERDDLQVTPFVREPSILIRRAERVVTMGGYNSVAEVLAFSARALVVPRVRPRLEQLERANYLARLGLVDVLHPDQATPEAIAGWWRRARPRPRAHEVLDLGGLARVPELALELLRLPPVAPVPVPSRTGHATAF